MDINLDSIISYLVSPDIQQRVFWVKVGFLSVGGFFLAGIIFCLSRTHYLQWRYMQDFWEFLTFRPFGAKKITKLWNKILKRLDTDLESEYKLALIEADDMLDVSLKRMGYMGQTLEERLGKLTSATIDNLDDIYKAHEIRNTIVHNPDYRLSLDEARSTLDIYQKAFNSLQILT